MQNLIIGPIGRILRIIPVMGMCHTRIPLLENHTR